MSKEKEILDRLERLEQKVVSDYKNIPRNEILGMLDCAKRDMIVQQKKYQKTLVREKLSLNDFKKKVFKRLAMIEIITCLVAITFIIFLSVLFFYRF